MSNSEKTPSPEKDLDLEKLSLWGKIKKWIHARKHVPRLKVGHICWVNLGQNIGSETYGKGNYFTRPVLILSRHFQSSAVVIPLTSKKKEGFLYHTFYDIDGNIHYALLYQIRYIDGKRIGEQISAISVKEMKNLKLQLLEVLGLV